MLGTRSTPRLRGTTTTESDARSERTLLSRSPPFKNVQGAVHQTFGVERKGGAQCTLLSRSPPSLHVSVFIGGIIAYSFESVRIDVMCVFCFTTVTLLSRLEPTQFERRIN